MLGAAILVVTCVTAVLSPAVPWWLTASAAIVCATALWRTDWALVALLALAPWGARLATVPVRATEFLCAAFLIGWLLRLDRPLRLAGRGALTSALAGGVYALLAAISWGRLAFQASPDTGWARVLDALRILPADYLVTAGRDPHTAAALQIMLGVVLCCAASTIIARDGAVRGRLMAVIALVGVVAAAATIVAVPIRYWLTDDTNELIRYFVSTRSRYSFHVPDVNAAGSHFILSGLLLLGVAAVARRRVLQWMGIVIVAAALWICGSRTAMAAGAMLLAFWFSGWRLAQSGWRWPAMTTRTIGAVAGGALLVLALSPVVLGSASAMSGSASRSMSVREEFLVTSTRMLSTAPVLGVGVGTYYQRSSEFMPPGIRALYGKENAHDYYMQTAAELGIVGVVALVAWLGLALAPLWRAVGASWGPTPAFALLLGCVGFLLTCITGHPFLVVEVSVPFWAALGIAMSAESRA